MSASHVCRTFLFLCLTSLSHKDKSPAPPPSICHLRTWTNPVAIAIQPIQVMRNASLSSGGTFRYALGTDIRDPLLPVSTPISFAGVHLQHGAGHGNKVLPAPPGPHDFLYPRGYVSKNSKLHMIWGDVAKGPKESGGPWYAAGAASLWAATYDSTSGWTHPELIYDGPTYWMKSFNDQMSTDAGSAAISVGANDFSNQVLYLSHSGEAWHVTPLTTGALQSPYSSVIKIGNRVIIAYVSADPRTAGNDQNSIFLKLSQDAGHTFSTAARLDAKLRGSSYEVRLRASSNGALHLVWIQEGAHGDATEIMHSISRDSGQSWSELGGLRTHGAVNSLQAAVGDCEDLHIVFEHRPTNLDIGHLDFATWRSRWTGLEHLFDMRSAADPALAQDEGAGLVLTFISNGKQQISKGTQVNYVSRFTP